MPLHFDTALKQMETVNSKIGLVELSITVNSDAHGASNLDNFPDFRLSDADSGSQF